MKKSNGVKISKLLEFHDLILCITSALEARDPYTSMHSSRVAEMTEAICTYLGIEGDKKEVYHIAAHLHDIGKIGIRDEVLLKNGPLNNEEWEIMKSHCTVGYQILMNVKPFYDVASIVRSHHERYDGKGYPDRLSGDEIPEGARIIAVADSIDAMLSDRPYRKGMDPEVCRYQIEINKGKMYDPEIASAALSHWDNLLRHRDLAVADCRIAENQGKTAAG